MMIIVGSLHGDGYCRGSFSRLVMVALRVRRVAGGRGVEELREHDAMDLFSSVR